MCCAAKKKKKFHLYQYFLEDIDMSVFNNNYTISVTLDCLR